MSTAIRIISALQDAIKSGQYSANETKQALRLIADWERVAAQEADAMAAEYKRHNPDTEEYDDAMMARGIIDRLNNGT